MKPILLTALLPLALAACAPSGGDTPASAEPAAEATTSAPADDAATASPATGERKEPVFTEGMTVEQAIGAVPSHYDYIGLDQDVLAKPLTQIETYKECNVKQSDKFTVRIAVWDGKVVGADVKSPNQALQQCIDRVVRQLEYKDKVESINTVEYTF